MSWLVRASTTPTSPLMTRPRWPDFPADCSPCELSSGRPHSGTLVLQKDSALPGYGLVRGVSRERLRHARMSNRYDDSRVFLYTNGSTRNNSMELPLWRSTLRERGTGLPRIMGIYGTAITRSRRAPSREQREKEGKDELEDEFQNESGRGAGGVGSTIESAAGRGGSLKVESDVGPIRVGGRRKRAPNVRLQNQEYRRGARKSWST